MLRLGRLVVSAGDLDPLQERPDDAVLELRQGRRNEGQRRRSVQIPGRQVGCELGARPSRRREVRERRHHGRRQCGRRRCRQGPRWDRREARGRRHDPAQRRGGDLSRDTPQARGNRRAQKLQPARASNSRRRLLSSSPGTPVLRRSRPFPKTRSCPTQTPSWTPPGSPPARSVNLHRLHRPVPGNNGRTRLRPPASQTP